MCTVAVMRGKGWCFNQDPDLQTACCLVTEFFLILLGCSWWIAAHQAPLTLGFPRQEYWSGWPFPSPGDLPKPGIECPGLLHCRQTLYRLSHQGNKVFKKQQENTCHIYVYMCRKTKNSNCGIFDYVKGCLDFYYCY